MSEEPDSHETRWSRVEARDYDYLVRRFWEPLHRFMASRLPAGEDAEGLTQEMFCGFIERDMLAGTDRERGTLRSYLFRCARNFLIDHHRRGSAVKRGGGEDPLPLDALDQPVSGGGPTPEQEFDAAWYLALLHEARRAVKEHYAGRENPAAYRAFRLFYFGDDSARKWTQQAVADELDMPVTQINNYLHRARGVFAQELRAALASCVDGEAELEREMEAMISVLAGQGNEPHSTIFGDLPS